MRHSFFYLLVCSTIAEASEAKKYSTGSPGLEGAISEVDPGLESTLKAVDFFRWGRGEPSRVYFFWCAASLKRGKGARLEST